MGMSIEDFDLCAPREFQAIADAWQQGQTQRYRDSWERARMMCLCALQPYSEKRLRPRDIMEFEWDKKAVQTMSEEELKADRKHYEEVKRARGIF